MTLPIGEVATRTGLSIDTLRYYERVGLLPEAGRNAGGHRRYPEAILEVCGVITTLRAAGFSLAQISDVLGVKVPGASARARVAAMRTAIDGLERDLDARAAAIQAARAVLTGWRTELDAGEPYSDEPLPC